MKRPSEFLDASDLAQYRQHLRNGDLGGIIYTYPSVRPKFHDFEEQTVLLAAVHETYRKSNRKADILPSVITIIENFIKDIRSGELPPSRAAIARLLAIFREAGELERGYHFWEWLKTQDDTYVDSMIYGLAIELLAHHGHPLDELETLYDQALKRFPRSFAEYNLSPNAIVPDRTQIVTLAGISTTLLKGIVFARIRNGDWRNAYLGLDTVLRLHPTQTPLHFLELFIYNRPVAEAFKVFMLACRAGIVIPAAAFNYLLNRLSRRYYDSSRGETFTQRVAFLRSVLNALQAYGGIGGIVTERHLSTTIKGFTSLVAFCSTANSSAEGMKRLSRLTRNVVDTIKSFFQSFVAAGLRPTIGLLNNFIIVGSYAGRPELIEGTLADMQKLGFWPNEKTYRSLLTAQARLGNVSGVISAWENLERLYNATRQPLLEDDWVSLASACRFVRSSNWTAKELGMETHTSLGDEMRLAEVYARAAAHVSKPLVALQDPEMLRTELDASEALSEEDLVRMETQTSDLSDRVAEVANEYLQRRQLGDVVDFTKQFMTIDVLPAKQSVQVGTRSASRDIYEELSQDPLKSPTPTSVSTLRTSAPPDHPSHVEATAKSDSPADNTAAADVDDVPSPTELLRHPRSRTNIRLDELRYLNWAAINELLAQAEDFELARKRESEAVGAADEPSNPGGITPNIRQWDAMWFKTKGSRPRLDGLEGDELRRYIFHLRGL